MNNFSPHARGITTHRFVLLTSPDVPNAQAQLAQLHAAYVEHVVKNPLWRGIRREEEARAQHVGTLTKAERKKCIGLGVDISCVGFERAVQEWLARCFAGSGEVAAA
jgi:hypothetical protein